jgi:hypothetical protein
MKNNVFLFITLVSLTACKHEVRQPSQSKSKEITTIEKPDFRPETTGELMVEFALINDPDGYTFVRQNAGKNYKVTDTLKNGTIVLCMEPQGDWTGIDYGRTDDMQMGSVHKSRLKLISSYKRIPVVESGKHKVILASDGIRIEVTEKIFDRSVHKLQFNREEGYLETIDGKQIWGTDGNVPNWEYASVNIKIKNREISLPTESLENVFEPNLDYTAAHYDEANDILYISTLNSDGAGGYCLLWIIEKGGYRERVIMYGI